MAPRTKTRRQRQQAKVFTEQHVHSALLAAIQGETRLPPAAAALLLQQQSGNYVALSTLEQKLPPRTQPIYQQFVNNFFWLGLAYTALGRHSLALHCFQRALAGTETLQGQAAPPTVLVTRQVALAYAALGDYAKARVFLALTDYRMRECERIVGDSLRRSQGMRRNVAGGVSINWWQIMVAVVLGVVVTLVIRA